MHEPLLEPSSKNSKHDDTRPPAGWGWIYSIQSPSGRKYIGQTRYSLAKRYVEHCHTSSLCRAVHRAIVKYGPNNMQTALLAAAPVAHLNALEALLILEHQTLAPAGYNLTVGGEGHAVSEETRAKLSRARRERSFRERIARFSRTSTQYKFLVAQHEAWRKAWQKAQRKAERQNEAKHGAEIKLKTAAPRKITLKEARECQCRLDLLEQLRPKPQQTPEEITRLTNAYFAARYPGVPTI